MSCNTKLYRAVGIITPFTRAVGKWVKNKGISEIKAENIKEFILISTLLLGLRNWSGS